jgi:hypothetical protein
MSWISDVRQELRFLDISKRSLRKFGLSVGAVLLLIALWMTIKNQAPLFRAILGVTGILLVIGGLIIPQSLRKVYGIWMGMAFAIGWVVSRALLIGMFFFVLTPIGFIARLFKKEFMDVKFIKSRETFWVKKKIDKTINYEKMY